MDTPGWFGPFRPVERVARGGMGEVWRAHHPELGLEVAVKVVPSAARAAFDSEVANAATLVHPGIVQIFDRGLTGAAWGGLPAGTPWMAMELAETTLALRPPRDLRAIRGAVLQVLDALGHAHGRGVLHLDVKPSNLLRDGDRVLLADFGISAVTHGARAVAWGTPGFAPAEQLEGRWRDLGPWTDVYALGATAASWLGDAAPDGFAGWVRRATQPLPAARFRSAAEAREALLDLGDEASAAVRAPALEATAPLDALPAESASVGWRAAAYWPRTPPARPPPEPWRRQLAGAGASVFGQRTVPLLAREAERDRLWDALLGVFADRGPRWVWLTGPSGVGKSRLAAWLATHAHAATGCRVWRAGHDALGRDGLREAARDVAAAHGLAGPALERRVADVFGAVPNLAAWLDGRPLGPVGAARALAAALEATSPALLWVDDAQDADPELLAALEPALRGAVLVVGTWRVDALDERARARQATLPGERLALGPLADEAVRTLLGGLLGLDAASASALAERAEGNAMVAAHLVAGAIERGDLRPGPEGLRVHAGDLRLPRSVTEVWERRLAQVAGDDRDAFELAAILGNRFGEPWRRALRAPVDDLVARALRAQLWWVDGAELRWTHEMAREAVLVGVAQDRLAELHRRAADAVDAAAEPGRAGRHRVGAGELAAGAALLLESVRRAAAAGEWLATDRDDRELELALGRLGRSPLQRQRLLERARMAANRRRPAEARAHLDEVRDRVLAEGSAGEQSLFHWLRGETLLLEHRPEEALDAYRAAEAVHGGDPNRWVRLLRAQARALAQLGRLDQALGRLDEASALADTLPDPVVRADVALSRGTTLHRLERLDEALAAYHAALRAYGEGHPGPRSQVWNNVATLHRDRGASAEARAAWGRARQLAEAVGIAADEMDLAEAQLLAGEDPAAARAMLEALAGRAAGTVLGGLAHWSCLRLCEDPARWDHHWDRARAALPDPPADPDLAVALAGALAEAERRGWAGRADRLRPIARAVAGGSAGG